MKYDYTLVKKYKKIIRTLVGLGILGGLGGMLIGFFEKDFNILWSSGFVTVVVLCVAVFVSKVS